MPAFSKDAKEYYESRIRTIMIVCPDVSIRGVVEALATDPHNPLKLDKNYVMRAMRKIIAERAHRNDRLNIKVRLAKMQDKYRIVAERLWAEASDILNPGVVRVMALEKLMKLDMELLNSEMDAKLYDRAIGTLDVVRKPISIEQADGILKALNMWGILPEKPREVLNITATEKPSQENATANATN